MKGRGSEQGESSPNLRRAYNPNEDTSTEKTPENRDQLVKLKINPNEATDSDEEEEEEEEPHQEDDIVGENH